MAPVRTRIAPSPTGNPHVGTAYTALFNVAFARQQGGQFVLRIEDTDRTRYDPDSEGLIFDTLRWLKLDWDEGPDVGGPFGPYRQSERTEIYREVAEQLVQKGAAYRCWCTPQRLERIRQEAMARKEPFQYDQFCLGKTEAERRRLPDCADRPVVRLLMPDEGTTVFTDLIRGEISFENRLIDDQVLLKSDGFPTYHLAAPVDDHLMRISHIIRGEDWISSTPKHIVLYDALGWEFPKLAHMSLLRNVDKSRISKRKNPWANLRWFREQGYLPEALVNFLALMGFSMPDGREVFGIDDIIAVFSFDRLSVTGPGFDLTKLDWLNGHYIRSLSVDQVVDRTRPYLIAAGITTTDDVYLRRVLALEQERIHKLAEAPELTRFFFEDVTPDPKLLVAKGLDAARTAELLRAASDAFGAAGENATASELEERFRALAEQQGVTTGQLFGAIRVAITGTTKAPPLFDTAVTLGLERVLRRIDRAIAALEALAPPAATGPAPSSPPPGRG